MLTRQSNCQRGSSKKNLRDALTGSIFTHASERAYGCAVEVAVLQYDTKDSEATTPAEIPAPTGGVASGALQARELALQARGLLLLLLLSMEKG